jgi:hypothetical protein
MRDFFRTLAPEQFDADVSVHADGSYTYSYDGNLIFVPALIQLSRAGYLEAHFEARLKNAAALLIQEGFQRAEYLGGGRYLVVLERSRARGEPSYFPSREMKVFSIRPQPDGSIVISASRPDASAPCQLIGTDAEIDGMLAVRLEEGVEVLKHNAQMAPSAPTGFGPYHWRIKSPDADPFIIVRPARSG